MNVLRAASKGRVPITGHGSFVQCTPKGGIELRIVRRMVMFEIDPNDDKIFLLDFLVMTGPSHKVSKLSNRIIRGTLFSQRCNMMLPRMLHDSNMTERTWAKLTSKRRTPYVLLHGA